MHYLLDHQILVLQYRNKYLDIEFYEAIYTICFI